MIDSRILIFSPIPRIDCEETGIKGKKFKVTINIGKAGRSDKALLVTNVFQTYLTRKSILL